MRAPYVFLATLLLLPLLVRAQEITVIPRDETLSGNVFRLGQRIDVDGVIEGDAILIGTDVTVNGEVRGDLLVLASTLRVNGPVGGSVRALATTLDLSAEVGRNVTVLGSVLTQGADAPVGGSLSGAFSTLRVNGPVGGSVDVLADEVVVGGTVAQDVRVRNEIGLPDESAGVSLVRSDATIRGTFVHYGPEAVTVEEGATIVGGVREETASLVAGRTLTALRTVWKLAGFLALLLVGSLFLWAFRRSTNAMTNAMVDAPWRSVLFGLGALVLVPFAVFLLAVTVVGVPLGLFVLAFYLMGLYLAKVMAALVLGRWLVRFARRRALALPDRLWVPFLVGALTLTVFLDFLLRWPHPGAAWLNAIGNLVAFLLGVWGLGGILIGKYRLLRKEHRGEVPS